MGEKGVNCMRVESRFPVKNGGWFHPFNETFEKIERPARVAPVKTSFKKPDFTVLLERWKSQTTNQVSDLADQLRVSLQALEDLGACYSREHSAIAFPMYAEGKVVGIRLRNDHRKWAVLGSKAGLFVPFSAVGTLSTRIVLICEGPTDTAAALTLGFFSLGRPACLGCEELVALILEEIGTIEAVICYDNDGPGIRGANKLGEVVRCSVVRFVPPLKDLRAYVANGGTKELLVSMINNCVRTRKKRDCLPCL